MNKINKDVVPARCSNSADCFACFGFFTVALEVNSEVFVPRCTGLSHVGNMIRVQRGEVKKTPEPLFFITTADGTRFTVPDAAVLEIRDGNGEIVCIKRRPLRD